MEYFLHPDVFWHLMKHLQNRFTSAKRMSQTGANYNLAQIEIMHSWLNRSRICSGMNWIYISRCCNTFVLYCKNHLEKSSRQTCYTKHGPQIFKMQKKMQILHIEENIYEI